MMMKGGRLTEIITLCLGLIGISGVLVMVLMAKKDGRVCPKETSDAACYALLGLFSSCLLIASILALFCFGDNCSLLRMLLACAQAASVS